MDNDDPDESIAIHCLQGTVTVRAAAEEVAVQMGQLVCLAGGNPWQVVAASDSLFLLTVGRARAVTAR